MSDSASPGEFSMPQAGPQHHRLRPFAGTFSATVKLWMGPGEPNVTTGRMVNTFQLGGLYLQQDYQGDASDGPYPAFEGKGFWGFNTTTGKYEGFWIDNASTMMQIETGDVDATGKVWTMLSDFTHPATGQAMKKRSVITLIDDNRHTMEMYFVSADGHASKSMEIDYRRDAS